MTKLEELARAFLATDDKTRSLYERLQREQIRRQKISDQICRNVAAEGNFLKRIVYGKSLLTVAPAEGVVDRCAVDYVMQGQS